MSDDARQKLIRQLRGAYSGELAAGFAYHGHWNSVSDPAERAEIKKIEDEEWHHREQVGSMLRTLGGKPSRIREAIFWCIGKGIAFLCHVGGWFIPMYGAGRLERGNIVEYEEAAVYANECGHPEMIEDLLEMAEVEWEHERYFRSKVEGHFLLRVLRVWKPSPPRESIRARWTQTTPRDQPPARASR